MKRAVLRKAVNKAVVKRAVLKKAAVVAAAAIPAAIPAAAEIAPLKRTGRRRGLPGRSEAVAAIPLAAAAASPTGESYGEEGWREEELSAGELAVDGPELEELEEEMGGPEVGGAPDEDAEW